MRRSTESAWIDIAWRERRLPTWERVPGAPLSPDECAYLESEGHGWRATRHTETECILQWKWKSVPDARDGMRKVNGRHEG